MGGYHSNGLLTTCQRVQSSESPNARLALQPLHAKLHQDVVDIEVEFSRCYGDAVGGLEELDCLSLRQVHGLLELFDWHAKDLSGLL